MNKETALQHVADFRERFPWIAKFWQPNTRWYLEPTDKVKPTMNTERKTLRLIDIFSEEELQKAITICANYTPGEKSLAQLLKDRVVTEALPRINERTRQDNDAGYLAYLLEYALCYAPGHGDGESP